MADRERFNSGFVQILVAQIRDGDVSVLDIQFDTPGSGLTNVVGTADGDGGPTSVFDFGDNPPASISIRWNDDLVDGGTGTLTTLTGRTFAGGKTLQLPAAFTMTS